LAKTQPDSDLDDKQQELRTGPNVILVPNRGNVNDVHKSQRSERLPALSALAMDDRYQVVFHTFVTMGKR